MINTTESTPTAPRLSIRVQGENPLHHLWNNNGTWWCHATVHLADFTKRRLRTSLRTSEIEQARLRRDTLFARLGATERGAA